MRTINKKMNRTMRSGERWQVTALHYTEKHGDKLHNLLPLETAILMPIPKTLPAIETQNFHHALDSEYTSPVNIFYPL